MSTASTSTARARAFQLVARDRGARGANRRAGGVMWARRAARVLAAGARMTPAVPRWGIAPGAVPLVRGPGGIARGTIVVAAARGFNGDSGSPTGGRDGQSEMRGAGRRDADPQVQWFGAADAPQQQAPAANGGTNANRGGPGGKGAPNPFVRRDASQGGSQGAAATAPGRGGAAPSTPVPSDLNKSGGQGAPARAQQQQAARPAKPATPQAPPRTQAPRQTQAPATCPDPLPPIHRGRGSRRYRRADDGRGMLTASISGCTRRRP